MEEYDIIKRYKKGVSMDISEIRQRIDANREKLASFRGSLWPRKIRGRDCHLRKQDDRTWFLER